VLRQHPGEAIVSFVALTSTTALLGVPAVAITVFYLIANPITVLQHINIRIPARLDRWLSYVFNTPNMHKVHHLEEIHLSNSNYGYVFSLWDRCFGTFIEPSKEMRWKFGMVEYSADESTNLIDLLAAPLDPKQAEPETPELPPIAVKRRV
jgi:sterol desaturase/sphingolipid hydroxylase (fatty acid hydroxylase superfamily)